MHYPDIFHNPKGNHLVSLIGNKPLSCSSISIMLINTSALEQAGAGGGEVVGDHRPTSHIPHQ